jgi:hypothetical protein
MLAWIGLENASRGGDRQSPQIWRRIRSAAREDRLLNIQRGGSVLKNLNCASGELFDEQISNL